MVNWSQRARADLRAVHDYIAKDSPQNAKAVAREIRRRADGIEAAPLGGRKVPELNDEQVREISAYPPHCVSKNVTERISWSSRRGPLLARAYSTIR